MEEKRIEKYKVYNFSEYGQYYEIFWKVYERNLNLKRLGGLTSDPPKKTFLLCFAIILTDKI